MDEELYAIIDEILDETYFESNIQLSEKHEATLYKGLIYLSYAIMSVLIKNNISPHKILLEDTKISYNKNDKDIEYVIPLKNSVNLFGGIRFLGDDINDSDTQIPEFWEMAKDGIQQIYLRIEYKDQKNEIISQEIENNTEVFHPVILSALNDATVLTN